MPDIITPTVTPAGEPRRTQPAARRTAGFTLIEILVVVIIIGVIVSAATLAVGVLGRDREVEDESKRFWAIMRQAREEAELQGRDVAVFVSAAAYSYMRLDPQRNLWVPLVGDRLYEARELPEGLRFRLWLDGREVVLKPEPPDRSDEGENKKWPPQIMVLSSGEIMPFELRVERDRADALFRVVALPDSDLRLERRESEREWRLMLQTKPPVDDEDEDEDEERLSDASR